MTEAEEITSEKFASMFEFHRSHIDVLNKRIDELITRKSSPGLHPDKKILAEVRSECSAIKIKAINGIGELQKVLDTHPSAYIEKELSVLQKSYAGIRNRARDMLPK